MECKDFHLRLKQRFNVSVKCLILMTLMMPTVEAKLRLLAAREVVGGQFTTGKSQGKAGIDYAESFCYCTLVMWVEGI